MILKTCVDYFGRVLSDMRVECTERVRNAC